MPSTWKPKNARKDGRVVPRCHIPYPHWFQQTIQLCRTDRQQFLLKSLRQRRGAPLLMYEPFWQCRLEKFAAQLIARQPDRLEHGQQFRRIINDFGPGTFGRPVTQRPVQQPQGGFAMIPTVKAKLVKNTGFVQPASPVITAVDLRAILALGGQTHSQVFGNHEYESTYQQTPRPPPSPGNI